MKTNEKESPHIAQNITEKKKRKKGERGGGKNVYLNAETLRFVDQYRKEFKVNRSKAIQQLILTVKKGNLVVASMIENMPNADENLMNAAKALRKMAMT